MRRLWRRGRAALRPLPRDSAAPAATALRALWRAHRLARRALPRVFRPPPGVRVCPLRRRLRRRRPTAGRRLEGAWPPPAGGSRRRPGLRDSAVASGPGACVRARRPRPCAAARPPPRRATCARARRAVVPPRALAARAQSRGAAADRPRAYGATAQHVRRLSGERAVPARRCSGRRRLYERRHGRCRGLCPSKGGSAPRRNHHVRASRPLGFNASTLAPKERRCNSR